MSRDTTGSAHDTLVNVTIRRPGPLQGGDRIAQHVQVGTADVEVILRAAVQPDANEDQTDAADATQSSRRCRAAQGDGFWQPPPVR
jgi:hypothetical protein